MIAIARKLGLPKQGTTAEHARTYEQRFAPILSQASEEMTGTFFYPFFTNGNDRFIIKGTMANVTHVKIHVCYV